jgi:sulfite dehydrogenase
MSLIAFPFFKRAFGAHPSMLCTKALLMGCATGSLFVLPAYSADEAAQMKQGKTLFTSAVPACAICHTLKDADSEGAVGPILDEIKPDSARVAKALLNGLGNMPSYKATLTGDQIAALARYVSRASGGEKN